MSETFPLTKEGQPQTNVETHVNVPLSSERVKELDKKYLLPEYQEAESGLEKLKSIFNNEKIKSLSTDDYIKLLRDHPSDMLTHVVRQGLRDHASTIWHKSGLNEKHDGFVKLLASGGLKSVLGRDMEGKSFDETVRAFCKLDTAVDRFTALESIHRELENTSFHSNSFADKSSVHFATSVVMDEMYGGEKGNEIFFVLPSVVAGVNYKYSGKIENGSPDQNNDVWLHTDPANGVELDTGFCFIPENSHVSSHDGSRYNEDGSLVVESVASKDYWEEHFIKTGTRPKHIIYYDSSLTPTEALQKWSRENNIATGTHVEELEESRVDANTANHSEQKDGIKKRSYELINAVMPANEAFFEKVSQYEKEESQSHPEVNLDVYLLNDEDRQGYKDYKDKIYSRRFYVSMDSDYETKVKKMNMEQVALYNKYLDDLYDWQNGPKTTPPPFNPLFASL